MYTVSELISKLLLLQTEVGDVIVQVYWDNESTIHDIDAVYKCVDLYTPSDLDSVIIIGA
mgnify:CR=1 FL=1